MSARAQQAPGPDRSQVTPEHENALHEPEPQHAWQLTPEQLTEGQLPAGLQSMTALTPLVITPPAQAPAPVQEMSHEVASHVTGPAQEFAPLHTTVHDAAPAQSTPPAHSPAPHSMRHEVVGGHVTTPAHVPVAAQFITQPPLTQVPPADVHSVPHVVVAVLPPVVSSQIRAAMTSPARGPLATVSCAAAHVGSAPPQSASDVQSAVQRVPAVLAVVMLRVQWSRSPRVPNPW
jgi:hypothetical protein